MRASVTGWGIALPQQRLTNADLERRVDTSDEWIVDRTGIRERRIAKPGETTASLAIEAATAAIKHAGIPPDAVDLLIIATATPEQPIPHTGAFVGEGLGVRCGSFDLAAGCAGFVYMLVVARGFRLALITDDGFSKLLAAGLTFTFAIQTFIIVGGITRLIPLTVAHVDARCAEEKYLTGKREKRGM